MKNLKNDLLQLKEKDVYTLKDNIIQTLTDHKFSFDLITEHEFLDDVIIVLDETGEEILRIIFNENGQITEVIA